MGSRIAAGGRITASFLNAEYTNADGANTTVTAASLANLSSVYPIPASDAAVGTIYKLTAWGNGTWGGTQQKLTFAIALAGVAIGTEPLIASTAFPASTAFDWRAKITLQCITTGSSGTWSAMIEGLVNETGSATGLLPATVAQNTVGFTGCTHTDVTQDTTVANNLAIQAMWGSTTGAPTISTTCTVYDRRD